MSALKAIMAIAFLVASFGAPVTAFAQDDELSCDDFTNREAAEIVADSDNDFEDMLTEDGEVCPDLPSSGGGGSPILVGINEDDFGFEEIDDAGEDEFWEGITYEVAGDTAHLGVFWLNDAAAHVIMVLTEPALIEDALELGINVGPADGEYNDEVDDLDGGALLLEGESELLEELYTDDDYDDLEVGGRAGDVRIILIPSLDDPDLIQAVSVGIGQGDEWDTDLLELFEGEDPDVDDPDVDDPDEDDPDVDDPDVDADTEAYLQTVRESSDEMLADITRFSELLLDVANWTTEDQSEFLAILDRWAELEDAAASLDVPDGMEEIQEAYELAASELTSCADNLNTFLTSGGSDNEAFTDATTDLQEAITAITTLNSLLTAAGA